MAGAKIDRVAIYARLSRATEESVSIERQIESARNYAKARGWTVVLEAKDDGVSATRNKPEDRRGWQEVLHSPEDYQAVIVWKIDRLARRVLDFLHADEELQKRGAALVAVDQPIDMTSPEGRGFTQMLAIFGEMEAAAIAARVTAARRTLLNSGRRVGGRPPFGYMNIENPDGPGVILAQDPATIDFVRQAAARAAEGASPYSIARWLEASGVRPRPRRVRDAEGNLSEKPVAADFWHEASVDAFLRAPALAGLTPYSPGRKPKMTKNSKDYVVQDVLRGSNGLPVVDESIAIMTPAERRAMLATMDSAKRPGARTHGNAEPALLYGLARCDGCGSLLHRASSSGGYTTYRCSDAGKRCPTRVSISRPALEEHVVAEVIRVAGELPVTFAEVTAREEPSQRAEVEAAITDTLTALGQVDDLEQEEQLNARLRRLKAARREARSKPDHAEVTLHETGETFAEVLDRVKDVEERRRILGAAISTVTVRPPLRRSNKFDPDRVTIEWDTAESMDADLQMQVD
ncbi:DNA invertase Pin-like site-specific DNA recombinase [Isoptericola jiangsuensis]|uniref:DNA invertase Pin-like site-specific DNA recombinase n=1 Tax=Isoptericola jiangsuensis TaxID=548579 RepID=A0A2A9F150_9MICO|nr:recombinase family protein [Isoptericola jiangsuensis]PFG44149.1 DNA invertase Pin-like site-specific DNA recombinase [Isoptericola jiangsuensis]